MLEALHQRLGILFKMVADKPIGLGGQQGCGKRTGLNSHNLKGGDHYREGTLGVAAQVMESGTRWYHENQPTTHLQTLQYMVYSAYGGFNAYL
jgi:hypothetical protein